MAWIIQQQKSLELFVLTVWFVWNQRNQDRLHKPNCSLHLLAQLAKDQLQEFLSIQPPLKPPDILPWIRWKPPPPAFVKINFDGAVFSKENNAVLGVVIRNNDGLVFALQTERLQQAFSPEVTEALATHRGATLSLELGFSNAILEGDSQTLILALQHEKEILISNRLLVNNKCLCSRLFIELHYPCTRTESNKVAHNLAQYALYISNFVVWITNVPPQVFFCFPS